MRDLNEETSPLYTNSLLGMGGQIRDLKTGFSEFTIFYSTEIVQDMASFPYRMVIHLLCSQSPSKLTSPSSNRMFGLPDK